MTHVRTTAPHTRPSAQQSQATMIVTMDGPAGSGKSSAARALAKRLGFRFLDTGAMYRAVTFAAVDRGVELSDDEALQQLAEEITLDLSGDRVLLDGRDVTQEIRTFEITTATRFAADNPGVRRRLVQLQREAAGESSVVTEGRDQGTLVFPNAECKIYLTASERVRAERRFQDLLRRGEQVTFDDVFQKQHDRDEQDLRRPLGALAKAHDTIEVCTDGLSPEEVVDRLEAIVVARRDETLR